MAKFYPLNGFSSVFDPALTNEIQDNLLEYFDLALMDKGNYFNSTKGELAPNGEDYSKLRSSSNDHYNAGQVWEGFRKNWIWQSGVDNSPAPLVGNNKNQPGISGVYIDGVFQPTSGVGTYAHYVDYLNGRVIFDTAIPTGTTVQVEHSYRYINVVYANNVPWLREVQTDTVQPNSNFLDNSKGSWDIPPESRLQLPAVAVEVVPQRRFKGYQLGGGQWVYTDVLFHCIAEDEYTRNQLIDIISLQNDKGVYLFDSNKLNDAGKFPLDRNGTPVPSALRFPELVDQYNGGLLTLRNANIQQMTMVKSDVFGGIVRFTTEGIKTNI